MLCIEFFRTHYSVEDFKAKIFRELIKMLSSKIVACVLLTIFLVSSSLCFSRTVTLFLYILRSDVIGFLSIYNLSNYLEDKFGYFFPFQVQLCHAAPQPNMNLFGTFSRQNPTDGGVPNAGGNPAAIPANNVQGQNPNQIPNQIPNPAASQSGAIGGPIGAILSMPLNLISSLFNTLLSPLLRL